MKGGNAVYQESQAFDRKATAQAWIRKREAELYETGAIENLSALTYHPLWRSLGWHPVRH